jgi:hypothetical protein
MSENVFALYPHLGFESCHRSQCVEVDPRFTPVLRTGNLYTKCTSGLHSSLFCKSPHDSLNWSSWLDPRFILERRKTGHHSRLMATLHFPSVSTRSRHGSNAWEVYFKATTQIFALLYSTYYFCHHFATLCVRRRSMPTLQQNYEQN